MRYFKAPSEHSVTKLSSKQVLTCHYSTIESSSYPPLPNGEDWAKYMLEEQGEIEIDRKEYNALLKKMHK